MTVTVLGYQNNASMTGSSHALTIPAGTKGIMVCVGGQVSSPASASFGGSALAKHSGTGGNNGYAAVFYSTDISGRSNDTLSLVLDARIAYSVVYVGADGALELHETKGPGIGTQTHSAPGASNIVAGGILDFFYSGSASGGVQTLAFADGSYMSNMRYAVGGDKAAVAFTWSGNVAVSVSFREVVASRKRNQAIVVI